MAMSKSGGKKSATGSTPASKMAGNKLNPAASPKIGAKPVTPTKPAGRGK